MTGKRRVLVTGGCGFIGGHLVGKLVEWGEDLVILDNLSKGKADNIRGLLALSKLKLIVGDLLDISKVEEAVRDCELVFHLAANPEVRAGYKDPELDFKQNIVATYNLLEAMRKSPYARTLVFTSTSTVYGDAAKIPTPENYGPLIPISLYGASKLSCEALTSAYAHLFGIRATIFRFANVVGPGGHGVVQDLMCKLETNPKELEVLGDGTQTKSYMYIGDCIEAMLHGLERSEDVVSIFNIGSDDQIDVRSIARIVIEEMGLRNASIRFTGGVDGGRGWKGDVKKMLLDISRIRGTGWEPRYSSEESIKLTVRATRRGSLRVGK